MSFLKRMGELQGELQGEAPGEPCFGFSILEPQISGGEPTCTRGSAGPSPPLFKNLPQENHFEGSPAHSGDLQGMGPVHAAGSRLAKRGRGVLCSHFQAISLIVRRSSMEAACPLSLRLHAVLWLKVNERARGAGGALLRGSVSRGSRRSVSPGPIQRRQTVRLVQSRKRIANTALSLPGKLSIPLPSLPGKLNNCLAQQILTEIRSKPPSLLGLGQASLAQGRSLPRPLHGRARACWGSTWKGEAAQHPPALLLPHVALSPFPASNSTGCLNCAETLNCTGIWGRTGETFPAQDRKPQGLDPQLV